MMSGTIQNREQFLAKVAGRLGRSSILSSAPKREYNYQPQHKTLAGKTMDELVEIFKEHCERIHTDYYQTTTSGLQDTLKAAINKFGGGPVMITKDHRFDDFGLRGLLSEELPANGCKVFEWNPELGDQNISLAEKSNVGITFSEITLAESATVVLFASPEKGRSVSLLPTTYIAIIPKSSIVPRMTQAAQFIREAVKNGEAVPSSINFVTGPSNSADIEMNLVVGVHGPIKAAYIVVEDQ
ncbi:LutC/YkgG family protein [Peribacillus tepidiphilus]|uniref:LutC/YkgG family protein n=1 Tax=Peribacillus tepidiphilus TaxID=2652445 RepID=UPI001CDB729A|nr:lactate utilization protein C [Peribacillus tepidiphilus]